MSVSGFKILTSLTLNISNNNDAPFAKTNKTHTYRLHHLLHSGTELTNGATQRRHTVSKTRGREKSTVDSFPDNSTTWQHLSFSGRLPMTFHQGCWEEAGMAHFLCHFTHTLTSGALDRRGRTRPVPTETHTHTHPDASAKTHLTTSHDKDDDTKSSGM